MPYMRVNGIQLYYERHGAGAPLLLLHGLGSSARDWALQTDYFQQDYQVIVVDVRGHGQSGKPRERYTVAGFADDIATLLTALKLSPVHVVGLSMGGMIAFQLAVDHPELLRTMTIVNSGPALVPHTAREWLAVAQRIVITQFLGMRRIGEFLAPRLFPQPEKAEVRAQFVERWAENDKRAYMRAFMALLNWSVADQIGDIHTPTLVIASDNDYTPVDDKATYVNAMPNAELIVVAEAHHALPIEHSAQFNGILAAFLKREEQQPV